MDKKEAIVTAGRTRLRPILADGTDHEVHDGDGTWKRFRDDAADGDRD